ncbi:MAG TPA: glycine cleavage T C-terminal barrel domain-containing protein [Gemmatimonadaceae bacterium]
MRDTVAGTITPAEPSLNNIAGQPVVLTYGNPAAEYAALRQRAVVVDRSHRTRIRVRGPKALEMINGLVTNDTAALTPGQGQYAVALSPKGKIVADVRIFVGADGILTDTGARAGTGWRDIIRKYVNPRVAPYADESATVRSLGVFGPTARHVVEEMTGVNSSALSLLPPYSHVQSEVEGATVTVAHVEELLVDGFELFAPAESFDSLWHSASKAGASACGHSAWEIARVEAGRPEWGLDMDDATLAQEANFDELHAISYTKGCYVGQEVVARVHFKGHVNRHLRGLRVREGAVPPLGAALHDAADKSVGDVRTAVTSPTLGVIALGMVRREVEVGASLTMRWEGGEGRADVCALPFPGE